MHAPGFGMVDSMGMAAVVLESNHDIAPGAFPVRSARNTATSRPFRSPTRSFDSPRELTNEEAKQEDGVPNSPAAGIGVYAVEAQRVTDGNEDGTMIVAEAEHLKTKWYQRRWIVVGLALRACGFAAALVVLVVRQQSASSSSSLTSPPTVPLTGAPATPDPTPPPSTFAPIIRRPTTTSKPTSLTPVGMQLSIPNVTTCRSTLVFDSLNVGEDTTNGATIPSEIGLLTQLTGLSFYDNALTSTIPSEIGLLTHLTLLSFYDNALTSTIPSEIGLLTQLTFLDFDNNTLIGTIPSSLCSLPFSLYL